MLVGPSEAKRLELVLARKMELFMFHVKDWTGHGGPGRKACAESPGHARGDARLLAECAREAACITSEHGVGAEWRGRKTLTISVFYVGVSMNSGALYIDPKYEGSENPQKGPQFIETAMHHWRHNPDSVASFLVDEARSLSAKFRSA